MVSIAEFGELIGAVASVLAFPLLAIAVALLWGAYKMLPDKSGHFEISKRRRYLVIGLLISGGIAYAVDIADRMGWLEPVYANIPLTKVYDKTFTNQVVVIDGKDFIDCTFNGVTFRYNGGYYLFEGARIEGAIAIDTPNDTAGNAINLLTWLDSHTQNHALVERWKKLPPEHFK